MAWIQNEFGIWPDYCGAMIFMYVLHEAICMEYNKYYNTKKRAREVWTVNFCFSQVQWIRKTSIIFEAKRALMF